MGGQKQSFCHVAEFPHIASVGPVVLLQLDENVDKKRLETFPLVFYAAEHWVNHVKFEKVASQFEDILERLFNLKTPYLAAWAWVYDVDRLWARKAINDLPEHPLPPEVTALYYAALCGLSVLANYLIVTHAGDMNAKCGSHGTPLHAASYGGHLDVVRLLLENGANVNLEDDNGKPPLLAAYRRNNNLEAIMRLLLQHGADPDVWYDGDGLISHDAAYFGYVGVLELLVQHGADVNARGNGNKTLLFWASAGGSVEAVQFLLEHGAGVNAQSEGDGTPLSRASRNGHLDIVRVLLEHGADVHIRQGNNLAPFQVATSNGHTEIAKLLLEYGAEEEATA